MLEFLGLNAAEGDEPSTETFTKAGYESSDPAKYRRQGEVGDWKKYFTDQARLVSRCCRRLARAGRLCQ